MQLNWRGFTCGGSNGCFLLHRLKCHNKCTKEAPSCRISFLPSKCLVHSLFRAFEWRSPWKGSVSHSSLCLISFSHKDPEDGVRAVGHQQPRGPSGWSSAVWHLTKGNNQEGTDLNSVLKKNPSMLHIDNRCFLDNQTTVTLLYCGYRQAYTLGFCRNIIKIFNM